MTDWLWILGGLVTLLVSADLLVRGSVWIALALGIRPMVVGLTVVAFGTSAPELAASLTSTLGGKSGLATGTVLGSNAANIGLILGLTAAVKAIDHTPKTARFEVRSLLGLTILLPIPLLAFGQLDRFVGATLVAFLLVFTWLLLQRERAARREAKDDTETVATTTPQWILNLILVFGGLAGLKFGADWLVGGSSRVASQFGLSDQMIGVTIVAVGTSLPELAASIAAALKRQPELALGNVLGSNIFNFCMVLGVTATIQPLPFTADGEGLHLVAGILFTSLLAALLAFRSGISRGYGVVLFTGYLIYQTTTVLRG